MSPGRGGDDDRDASDRDDPVRMVARSRFRVTSGSCLDCVGDVAGALGRLPGVLSVDVLAAAGVILVEHDGTVAIDEVQETAATLGLGLVPVGANPVGSGATAPAAETARTQTRDEDAAEHPWWRRPRILALVVGGFFLFAALVTDRVLGARAPATALYLATVAVAGFYPTRSAIESLRRRRLTITTLLVVATAGALALGVVGEGAILVVVFSIGEVLEDYASDRARGSIRALMALAPPVALRLAPDGSTSTIRVEHLAPGERILVRPGERIPTDGLVSAGASAVDQSPVTGESVPAEVTPGSLVFGGTVNGTGALTVEVTKAYADTTLARIISEVEEAQASRGEAQRFADRFGAIYTPAMFVLAIAVATVPPLLGGNLREWLYRGLVVLTVSCSCALVISVPVSVVAGITRAARDGILIKGGVHLERLGSIRAIAFDKTGTLTRGRPELTDVLPLDGHSPDDILRLAAAVEAASEHPLAGAIVGAAAARSLDIVPGTDLRATPGVGVEATVDGARLFVGRSGGVAVAGLDGEAAERLTALEAEGRTVVVLAGPAGPIALLAVADRIREGAPEVVADLRRLGIRHALMLTGDNERTAPAIARSVGLDDWRAGLLPEDKTAAVVSLQADYGPIAMVGDGVNDAPALAAADVGVAMGAAGTDVALETADVALMADDLAKLPAAIRLSRRTLGNIHQNIIFSLVTVFLLVGAALAGWLSLTTGLLLNEGTALLIIANGLRLLAAPR